MEGESLNITNEQIEKLKQLFPETVTEGKIDWEKLQATLGKENTEDYLKRIGDKDEEGYLLTDKVVLKKAQGGEYRAQGEGFYSINDGEFIIVLNEINQELVESIISEKPKKVIMLDNLFSGNDQMKTNTVLQMKDSEIDFKTI